MILCTIVTGIITQDSAGAMKRISVRIIFYYITTTVLACIIGLSVSALIQPGHLANFIGMASEKITEAKPMDFASFAKGLFSTNMFKTFTDGNIIQTLIIAILVGIAILKMKDGEQKETIKKIMHQHQFHGLFADRNDHGRITCWSIFSDGIILR